LRDSFPQGTTRYFEIIFKRFISDFCGSESSYAGLIDETSVLWNSKRVSKWIPVKNLFYNLIVVSTIDRQIPFHFTNVSQLYIVYICFFSSGIQFENYSIW
jgi:hypothetical protein